MAKIFIGSSSESLKTAQIIQSYFDRLHDCIIWEDKFFELNQSTYDNLCKKVLEFDYAIFVGGIDDAVIRIKKNNMKIGIRDNVYFEFGLYVGTLTKDRVFFMVNKKVSIASDFLGVTLLYYNDKKEIINGCEIIKNKIEEEEKINRINLLPSTSLAYDYYNNFLKSLKTYLYRRNLKISLKKINEKKIKIVIPKNCSASMKDFADLIYKKLNCKNYSFNFGEKRISIKYNNEKLKKKSELEIIDVPLILEASFWAVETKLEKSYVGDTALLNAVKEKEKENFINTLTNFIKNDALLNPILEIISY